MARIIVATYMVRYPLGGMLSWALQWPLGFSRLGHDVFIVERAHYPDACFNPVSGRMTNNGDYGFRTVDKLLDRFGLGGRLAFIDWSDRIFGASKSKLRQIFRDADLLVDIGNHGVWNEEADLAGTPTVLVDGEPGFTQIKMENAIAAGDQINRFDHYFSNGANIGTPKCNAPSVGLNWQHVFSPVVCDIFTGNDSFESKAFSTVMNWQSHDPIMYKDVEYGQKDVEFERFLQLPKFVDSDLEVAAAGIIPIERLKSNGWSVTDAHQVTSTFEGYVSYISQSRAEFSVCKNVFVATRSGWFSDRSAAYLASGRPVVLQDTGFSEHLPCGSGLFAVDTVEEAVSAIEAIEKDYEFQCTKAKELAREFLDASTVLNRFLTDVGGQDFSGR